MSQIDPEIQHLIRRVGFGVSASEVGTFSRMSPGAAVSYFVDYEGRPDDVDARIGRPDHAQVKSRELFSPDTDIDDARQRWLFRMIHTRRPLQEKMALFWHNHFATAYSKLNADSGSLQAAKMMAYSPGTLRGPMGQIELFREYAVGNFRDLLIKVAQDAAMLVWLDGQYNTAAKPQENFGREVMELFTIGVGNYTEPDVYAAARVFSGWNLKKSEPYRKDDPNSFQAFAFNVDEHDTGPKAFSFPIYSNGSRTIAERGGAGGMQDGIDLLTALATHPATARRLARKLWNFFVSEVYEPDTQFVDTMAGIYLQNGTELRPVIRAILSSTWFRDSAIRFTRYSWPPEFVARAVKEVGWQGFSLDEAKTPLANMGMPLFEPPNVGGWPVGAGWFSTATMLARSNFGSALVAGQKAELAASLASDAQTASGLMTAMLDRISPAPLDPNPRQALSSYLLAGGAWSGTPEQVETRASGLARLLVGSAEYQLI
ncbi:MAG TPA: DUF1800 domain-containing protein [Vicinamibacterales bacterium]|nr:DUF1800 domain-containing protein [Vicinamibacterales bacterium]